VPNSSFTFDLDAHGVVCGRENRYGYAPVQARLQSIADHHLGILGCDAVLSHYDTMYRLIARRFASAAGAAAADAVSKPPSGLKTVGVLGAGQMGSGIGLVTAVHAKLGVLLVDQSSEQLKKAIDFNKKLLDKDVAKQRITAADAEAALRRICTSTSLADLGTADFVVEAVSENLDLKKKLFKDLSSVTRPDVILASNTSSISITKLQNAAVTAKPDKVCHIAFMLWLRTLDQCDVLSLCA